MCYPLGWFVFLLFFCDSEVYRQMLAESKHEYFYYYHYKGKLSTSVCSFTIGDAVV